MCGLQEDSLKGEMVIVVEGCKEEVVIKDEEIIARVNYFINLGLSQKDAINVVSEEFKLNKNYIKKLLF